MRHPALIACLSVALLPACEEPEGEPTPAPSELPDAFDLGPRRVCDSPVEGIARITEEGEERGLDFELTDVSRVHGALVLGRGGSVVASDFDRDGDADLAFGDALGAPIVLLNDGAGHFSRLQEPLAAAFLRFNFPMVLAAADLDGDRIPELLLAGGGWAALYQSIGPAEWAPPFLIHREAFQDAQVYLTMSLGDLDGDGDLDLALPGTGSIEDGPDPKASTAGSPDLVLLRDPSEPAWFTPPVRSLVTAEFGSKTQVAHLTDRDNDGDLDLFIPADLGPPSGFWRNDGVDGDGVPRLVDDAPAVSMDLSMAAMGIDSEDLNADGTLDYCISDVQPPRCMLSDGSGGWTDSSAALGILPDEPMARLGTVGWSVDLADLDHDGVSEIIQASGPEGGTYNEGWTELPNLLWRGLPEGGYDDVTSEVGFGDLPHHYGLATADYDGDGWLDIVVAGPATRPLLWMNRCGAAHWLEVELIGPPENTEGFGAQVLVTAGGKTWMRELTGLRGQGQGMSRVHVGLGDAEDVEALTIRWPDGTLSEARGFPSDRLVTVSHPGAVEPVGDDDDTLPEVPILGYAFDPDRDRGVEGVTVVDLAAPEEHRAVSRADGIFTLLGPAAEPVDLLATAPGMTPVLSPIHTFQQRTPEDGIELPMISEEGLTALYEDELSLSIEAGAGTLLVTPWGGEGPVEGATAAIAGTHGGSFVLGAEGIQPGDTLPEGGQQVIFANVPQGPVEVLITTPNGSPCEGRTGAPVRQGHLTVVRLFCFGG